MSVRTSGGKHDQCIDVGEHVNETSEGSGTTTIMDPDYFQELIEVLSTDEARGCRRPPRIRGERQ